MKNRMWSIAATAAICCGPLLAQATGGYAGQNGGAQSTGAVNQTSQPSSMGGAAGAPGQMDSMGTGQSADKLFVKKALQGNMAEVQMGQLALEKSNDDQVKQFAQRMVDDHGKMGDELRPVAEQMGVKAPDGPSKMQMKSMAKMQALSGDAFDQAYIKDMVKDHKDDDREFKQEAQTTQNPQLKQMVTQADQTIEGHLQAIQQIAQTKGMMKTKM